MSELTDAHKAFLQGMLSRGAATEEAAKQLHWQVTEALSQGGQSEDFTAFVFALNKRLKPLDMELVTVRMETSGEKWTGVVNKTQDAASKRATTYTPAQLEFFRKAMDYLVLEGEGSVDSMTLLHMAATLERKLSQKAAQEFLATLVSDNWFQEVEGLYGPGPRFLLELRPFLKEMFGEGEITDCASCKDPIVVGQSCGKLGCNVKLHPYCASRLAQGRVLKCPQCGQPWGSEEPTAVQQTSDGPSTSRSSSSVGRGGRISYLNSKSARPHQT